MSDEPGWQHGVTIPPPLGLETGWHDIGEGVLIRYVGNGSGEQCGIIEAHKNAEGEWCAGSVLWDVPALPPSIREEGRDLWTLEALEPLFLSPSISCGRCGHHGFIQNGRWVAA